MGTDELAVVDPELRVNGVAGLRVADASVAPTLMRGHPTALVMAIGERAAELIRRGAGGTTTLPTQDDEISHLADVVGADEPRLAAMAGNGYDTVTVGASIAGSSAAIGLVGRGSELEALEHELDAL